MVKTRVRIRRNATPPQPVNPYQDNFSGGVITVVDESKLKRNALKEADNLWLTEDGAIRVRPGIGWFGTSPNDHAIDGGTMHVTASLAVHLISVADGTIYRSVDDGTTWDTCTGGTFTAGKKVSSEQQGGFTYLVNGWDNIIRYDGTTTLQTYTAILSPAAPTVAKTGLAGATSQTLYYKISAVNGVGYTAASANVSVNIDRDRTQFDASNFIRLSWTAVTGATRYDIYMGFSSGREYYIDSVEGNTGYNDLGKGLQQVQLEAPTSNTTSGPRVGEVTAVGDRLYATQDRDFPYRVWISAAGTNIGFFSLAYDATYIDLSPGSQYRPKKIEDYRDGKGTPYATVWCDSVDGTGCIWQGTVVPTDVGVISYPSPNFYKLSGSRGTNASFSVVNVLNDYMYYNSQAFFNLGSRAQFLNLLSTDESSANIRNNVRSITANASSGICSYYYQGRVYFSVPYASSVNNATIVYDTERKAWLPRAFTVGFERFFQYTDTSGGQHLLAWKPGDTRFSEINENIKGDYNESFQTSLITGLIHINPKNRFDFLWCEEGEIEFAQPTGLITIELSGITREDGYTLIGDPHIIKPIDRKISWTTEAWTTHAWGEVSMNIATGYSEPSAKRYFNVQTDINAWQYRVQTDDIDAGYVLRTLQVNGTATQAGKPTEWSLDE